MLVEIRQTEPEIETKRLPEMCIGTVFLYPENNVPYQALSDNKAVNLKTLKVEYFGDDVRFAVTPHRATTKCCMEKVWFHTVSNDATFIHDGVIYRKVDPDSALSLDTLHLAKFGGKIYVQPVAVERTIVTLS